MRSDLWRDAQKAAAEQYGREHKFYVLVGHKLVFPAVLVGALLIGFAAVPEGSVSTFFASVGVILAVVAGVVLLVTLAVVVGRGPRLPGGRRAARLPRKFR